LVIILKYQEFIDLIYHHTKYRKEAINLIVSENCTSPMVRAALASDLGNRYAADFYGGTKFIQKIIAKTESYLRELFDVDYAIISPLSGNLCDLALILGLTKINNKIMVVDSVACGGYPLDYDFFGRKKVNFEFDQEKMNLLIDENITSIKKIKPKLVIFGSSFIPFPHPVKEITKEFEGRKTVTFAYDGSHVMGLIAGKQFQNPLKEGAKILIGSTHKSFPGPQGGIILTNDMTLYEELSSTVELDIEKGIRLVDNNHPNRIAALGIAALEMLEFGEDYAKQVIANSRTLARTLSSNGVPVRFKEQDFTESHQVILDTPNYPFGAELKNRAEQFGLIIDSGIRIGTSEITRMGMKELEVKEIGEILSSIYHGDTSQKLLRRVKNLSQIFQNPIYCFESVRDIPI